MPQQRVKITAMQELLYECLPGRREPHSWCLPTHVIGLVWIAALIWIGISDLHSSESQCRINTLDSKTDSPHQLRPDSGEESTKNLRRRSTEILEDSTKIVEEPRNARKIYEDPWLQIMKFTNVSMWLIGFELINLWIRPFDHKHTSSANAHVLNVRNSLNALDARVQPGKPQNSFFFAGKSHPGQWIEWWPCTQMN